MTVEMLDRSKPNTDPQGNEWTIVPSKMYPGLVVITGVNTKADPPKELKGHWTGKDKAQKALDAYLDKFWQKVDELKEKQEKRKGAATA